MDCDRVFGVLTAGPFPTGTELDRKVDKHLNECESCRRFAEALRPLEACDHESLPASQNWRLPTYRHAVTHAMASSRQRNATSTGDEMSHWSQDAGALPAHSRFGPVRPQVASFTLVPPSNRRVWWDVASLAALLMAVAVGGWGLGILAM